MATPTVTGQQVLMLPVNPLTPLDPNTRPTVEAIRLLRSNLYNNAAPIRSQYGGGQNGLLDMLMPPVEYNTITPGMPFKLPANGLDIPDLKGKGAKEMKCLYDLELANYNRALQFKVRIKWLLLQAIPHKYIAILRHHLMQFTNVSPAAVLTHMVTMYGRIRAHDLEHNPINIAQP